MHEHDGVGGAAGKAHLVRYQHHRHAVPRQLFEDPDHLADQLGIERRSDLVEQHQSRLHGKGAGNGDALLLAAGELRRICPDLVLEIDHAQHLAGERVGRLPRHPLGRGRTQRDVALDREMREEVVALEDDADLAAQRLETARRRREDLAVEGDGAAVRPLQPVDAAQERRLARTAAADDGDDLSGLDGERDLVKHAMGAERLRNAS